ncbi:MAG: hypothetical protein EHM45_08630 [Desulfobacteraceae bacterium]|nr:MAG: hypothetical protein EHM45_08630 [Desulfobacteraceae bacterium]
MQRRIVLLVLLVAVLYFSFFTLGQGNPVCQANPRQSQPQVVQPQTDPSQLQKVQAVARLLPDLVVDRIWSDSQCQINFRLRNAGRGPIPETEYRASVTRVQFGAEIRDFNQAQTDPSGLLKNAGGSVDFNTQISLKTPLSVKVLADFTRRIPESESGERNNEKTARLLSQCPSPVKVQPYQRSVDKAQTQSGDGSKGKRLPQGDKNKIASSSRTGEGVKAGKSNTPLQKRTIFKNPVLLVGGPHSTADGIKVTNPTQNTDIHLDFNLVIIWETFGPAADTLQFSIELWDPKKGKLAAKITPDTGVSFPIKQASYQYTWTIPLDLPLGLYRVAIKTFDNQYYAFSPDINVLPSKAKIPPGTGIKVTAPKEKQILAMGDDRQIEWKNLKAIAGNDIIELLDAYGNLIRKIDSNAADLGGTNSYGWKVPSDVPKGIYKIKISTSDGKYSGYSGDFVIIDKLIRLTYPPSFVNEAALMPPKQFEKGKSYTIKWEAYGLGSSKFTINLVDLNGKKPPKQIAVANPGATSYTWTVPTNSPDGSHFLEVRAAPDLADRGSVCIGLCPLIMGGIKTIKVKSPSKGTVWTVGDNVIIAYEALGDMGDALNFYLVPMAVGDMTNIPIGTALRGLDSKPGSYPWAVPSVKNGYYKIKIISPDSKVSAESEPFEITNSFTQLQKKPLIQVISPSKNTKWFTESSYAIQWSVSGPVDLTAPAMVTLLAPNGLGYSLSMPAIKLGAKSFNWKIASDSTTTQSGQYRIKISSKEGDAYSEPFTLLSTGPAQPPNSGAFKILSVKTWMYGPDPSKLSEVEVTVQANTDKDFSIGNYGHPNWGSLYLQYSITNWLLDKQTNPLQWYLRGLITHYDTYSCTGGSGSKSLEFPIGLIKKGQIFKVVAKFDPPLGDMQGVKTSGKSYFPELNVVLSGYTLSGVSKDEKTILMKGADLVPVPPGVKLDIPSYMTQ